MIIPESKDLTLSTLLGYMEPITCFFVLNSSSGMGMSAYLSHHCILDLHTIFNF